MALGIAYESRRRNSDLLSHRFPRRLLLLVVVLGVVQAFHLRRASRRRLHALEGERDELQALIDWIGEAVVALSGDGKVLRTNRAAVESVGYSQSPLPAPTFGDLITHPGLRELLEESLVRPFSGRDFALGDRRFLVSARSVEGGGADRQLPRCYRGSPAGDRSPGLCGECVP